MTQAEAVGGVYEVPEQVPEACILTVRQSASAPGGTCPEQAQLL